MTKENKCELFIKKSKLIHNDKYDYHLIYNCFVDNETKIPIICPIHGVFYQTPHNHKRGYGCFKCSYENENRKKRHTNKWFTEKSKQMHGKSRYDYTRCIYQGYQVPLILICHEKDEYGNEHGEFTVTPSNHLSERNHCGCPKCNGGTRKRQEDFVNEINTLYENIYDTSEVEYINNNLPVKLICPEHGEFYRSPQNLLLGYGCPSCNGSVSEREMIKLLNQHNIKYIFQYRPPFLKTSKYGQQSLDFYLPEYNIAIECQGIQHFRIVNIFGGENEFQNILKRDKEKYNRCINNDIKIIYFINNRTYNEIKRKNICTPDIYANNLHTNIEQIINTLNKN